MAEKFIPNDKKLLSAERLQEMAKVAAKDRKVAIAKTVGLLRKLLDRGQD